MKNLLITGGAGLIGSNLVKNLQLIIMFMLQIIYGEEKKKILYIKKNY